jgi:hypothetical protein
VRSDRAKGFSRVRAPRSGARINYVLQQVVNRGTDVVAGKVTAPVAGKTGTTENASDAVPTRVPTDVKDQLQARSSSAYDERLPWDNSKT